MEVRVVVSDSLIGWSQGKCWLMVVRTSETFKVMVDRKATTSEVKNWVKEIHLE